jgi:pimeloyl-ACP methyl ester carboxylesterase
MATTELPLILLVHGAWHGAWCWAALQAELDHRGIPSLAIDLPGHGASRAPFSDLHGDAAFVRSVVDAIAGPVVVVGHSYGGAVITQAAAGAANVRHLVYLAAFVLDEGEALLPLVQSLPPHDVALLKAMVVGEREITIKPDLATDAFFARCDPAVAAANTARLCPQPLATFLQPVTVAAWKTIPSTYVRCTEDEAVPLDHQDHMATRCGAIETIDTDHSPFASRTADTAAIIEAVVRSGR